jgi:hypothetical protein
LLDVLRSASPAIRARWPQRVLAWWTEHAPDELADALGHCSDGLASSIGGFAPTDWLDLTKHRELIGALRDRCGVERFVRAYVNASDHALRLPLFEGIIRPLVRLAGRRALLRGFPRGWAMIMRGCGIVQVVPTGMKASSDVSFTEVPIEVACDEAYRESVGSVLEALMARGGFPGTVDRDCSSAEQGELRYRLTER